MEEERKSNAEYEIFSVQEKIGEKISRLIYWSIY